MKKPVTILVAEDDDDDYWLIERILKKGGLKNPLIRVKDGEELLNFLKESQEVPLFILLDLIMPRKCGREALKEIRADRRFDRLPIVVLTSSSAKEDIDYCYGMGVNSFIHKPFQKEEFTRVLDAVQQYWLQLASLPKAS